MHSAPLSLPHHSFHTKESQLIPAPLLCWGGRHCKAVHPLFRVGWTLDFHQDLLRVTRIVSVFQSLFHLQVWMVIQDLYLLAVDRSTCVRMLVWTLLNCQVPWWRAQPRSAWAAKAWASEEAHVFSIGPAGFVAHLGGEGLWTEAGHPDWNCLGIWGMCDGRGGSNDWLRCKEFGPRCASVPQCLCRGYQKLTGPDQRTFRRTLAQGRKPKGSGLFKPPSNWIFWTCSNS